MSGMTSVDNTNNIDSLTSGGCEISQHKKHISAKTLPYKKLSKKLLYSKERLDILHRLNKIIGIDSSSNVISFCDIDSPDKLKQIDDLALDVKKYFKCNTWAYFIEPEKREREYYSLIRSLYVNMDYGVRTITPPRGRYAH